MFNVLHPDSGAFPSVWRSAVPRQPAGGGGGGGGARPPGWRRGVPVTCRDKANLQAGTMSRLRAGGAEGPRRGEEGEEGLRKMF